MADLLLDTQATPTTPASGKVVCYADSTTKRHACRNDTGLVTGLLSRNWSTASQGAGFSSDTYVTGSGIRIPECGMQVGQVYRWFLTVAKTAAGTAQVDYTIRIGSAQTTADTARWQVTAGVAQAASADSGIIIVTCVVRSVSASGVIAAGVGIATGGTGFGGGVHAASSSFDNSAVGGQYVGLSIDAGASAAWTLEHVSGELLA